MYERDTAQDPSSIQRIASDPSTSAYVAASAGTGKTKILTDRVLRLLLTGTPPQNILCITFTNAAAAEMLERIRSKLQNWLFISDEELQKDLENLGETPTPEIQNKARKLYGIFLENLNHIKIQTIHSLCSSILQKFSGNMSEIKILDDAKKQEFFQSALNQTLKDSLNDNGILKQSIQKLADFYDYNTISKFISSISNQKIKFLSSLNRQNNLYEAFNANPDTDVETIKQQAFSGSEELLEIAVQLVEEGEKNGADLLEQLQDGEFDFDLYKNFFLTLKGDPRQKLASKAFQTNFSHSYSLLVNEQERVLRIQEKINSQISAEYNEALIVATSAVLRKYEEYKAREGALEYDDLIIRTIELLKESDNAYFALYNLDITIDHILIDEAQDTSPRQWDLIKLLSEEFFAGIGAREIDRTIFIVGDFKQSIYSFQGADPRIFFAVKEYFAKQARSAHKKWKEINMNTSFRTTAPILRTVDTIFNNPEISHAVNPSDSIISHTPFRQGNGYIEVWPIVEKEKKEQIIGWKIPTEELDAEDPKLIMATQIASKIKEWLDSGRLLYGHKRKVEPKDILILIRKRGTFLNYLVAALKKLDIPVGNADRYSLTDHLIIKDLIALGKFILLPEDDLNLAELLKSPIIRISEDELFNLAHNREHTLWSKLSDKTYLESLIADSKNLSIYEFYSKVLEQDNKRLEFSKRFGKEADSLINSFLDLIITYEQNNIPTLQGFIQWLETSDIEIKSDALHIADEVRIMTTHSAKGLQAPIVFLADAASSEQSPNEHIFWHEGQMYFSPYAEFDNEKLREIKELESQKQYEENLRLLYVAMTRAEDELYVCGWYNSKLNTSWYNIIDQHIEYLEKPVDEYTKEPQVTLPDTTEIPDFLYKKADKDNINQQIYTPSQSAEFENKQMERGKLIHEFLHILPKMEQANWNNFLYSYKHPIFSKAEIKEIFDIANDNIKAFPNFFTTKTLSEIPVAAQIGEDKISAQIDKMIIEDDKIIIIDYKTDANPPLTGEKAPEKYIKQLAEYKKIIQAKHPNHEVITYILWTSSKNLQVV